MSITWSLLQSGFMSYLHSVCILFVKRVMLCNCLRLNPGNLILNAQDICQDMISRYCTAVLLCTGLLSYGNQLMALWLRHRYWWHRHCRTGGTWKEIRVTPTMHVIWGFHVVFISRLFVYSLGSLPKTKQIKVKPKKQTKPKTTQNNQKQPNNPTKTNYLFIKTGRQPQIQYKG